MIIGLNQKTLRIVLLCLLYGTKDKEKIEKGTFAKSKYVIPLQYQFSNPLEDNGFDTYCMYYIEKDKPLSMDTYTSRYTDVNGEMYDRTPCLANILLRFCGGNAEQVARFFRHQAVRDESWNLWRYYCNGERLNYVGDLMTRNIFYFGKNSEIGYDIRFKIWYNELIPTNWKTLDDLDFKVKGNIKLED